MNEKLWELYSVCFPENIRPEETVRGLLERPDNTCFTEMEDGRLLGAAVVSGNTVLMLCVQPEHRRRGIGSRLLEKSENHVGKQGFDEIQFCDGPGYLTPGIPLIEENGEFFRKRGYVHAWGDCECVDMSLRLEEFQEPGISLGDTVNGVTYRWAEENDRERVVACVDDGYPEFSEYYQAENLYSGSGQERVLLAEADGVVCGALLVAAGKEREDIGSVGCTVTREKYRNRGIATRMVQMGTGSLKAQGLKTAFLGYTYTDIVPMYQRSGYQICMKYMMGKKKLKGEKT